jgi:hypothetical protein
VPEVWVVLPEKVMFLAVGVSYNVMGRVGE